MDSERNSVFLPQRMMRAGERRGKASRILTISISVILVGTRVGFFLFSKSPIVHKV